MNSEDRMKKKYETEPEYTAQQVGAAAEALGFLAQLSPEAIEGLEMFQAMVNEHLEMVAEREEAIALIDCQNPEETFIGALRNLLQVKVSALENNERLWSICNAIAATLNAPRDGEGDPIWSAASLINTVSELAIRDREYTRFQTTIAELLDIQPGESVASAVQRLKDRQPRIVVSLDGFRLQKEFRQTLKDIAEQLDATRRLPLEYEDALEMSRSLRIIYSATRDAA